jgi:hypothetical protein
MRDYLEIGSTPAEEDCEQLGPNYRPERARQECQAFIHQLRRQFGEEPADASLRVKGSSHDFGLYLEVVCYYDPNDEESTEYAFKCEGEAWTEWDEEARKELSLPVA